ncbi:hypothetical protein SAMN05443636_1639 [Halobaculum gomorrense]|uniref:PRC-barrel domain-containing protein n=2 Tax=Halobaculum gomorrense TaxID=43928 RepID=A0A1M5PK80_9EURY|nr:hypothetical protein SAMN05443636_1639 [Halobaculum gomorrense]
MVRNFRAEDEGKRVMTADGDEIGTIEQTAGSTAHVKPAMNLSQSVRRRLGWAEEGEETYELRTSKVDDIGADEIRLKQNL